ncbi:hypothetical protein B0O99DRAFT_588008 [Bisporella sp. PMI_857]|nr:hypothetical protein B0O99DRAFT_588008 [Bisporella sp. PMI_857]
MAAFVKALNAKIRANPTLSYFCSTHFWGPASNFGIPLAAIADAQKSPELISGTMTGALIVYSATFMRYSLAVTPQNYLLFACHFINEGSQLTQGYRWLQYHKNGGKERQLREQAESGIKSAVDKVENEAQNLADKAKGVVGK